MFSLLFIRDRVKGFGNSVQCKHHHSGNTTFYRGILLLVRLINCIQHIELQDTRINKEALFATQFKMVFNKR